MEKERGGERARARARSPAPDGPPFVRGLAARAPTYRPLVAARMIFVVAAVAGVVALAAGAGLYYWRQYKGRVVISDGLGPMLG